MRNIYLLILLSFVQVCFAQPVTPGRGPGGTISGSITGAYSFSAGFTTQNATNVFLNPAISNLVLNPAITNINEGNIIYVRTNGNDAATGRSLDKAVLSLTVANSLAVSGDTMKIGSGTFDVGTNQFHFKHGVKYIGEGAGITTIAGRRTNGIVQFITGESTIQDFTLSTRVGASFATLMIGGDIGDHGALIGTNFNAQRVYFDGESDCIYYQGFSDSVPRTFNWRDCRFTSGFDFIYFGSGNTNVRNNFTFCDFTADLTSRTNTFNANRLTKWITVGYGGGGANMKFDHCSFTVVNSLYSYILESGDDEPTFPGLYKYFEFSNCTISQSVTNGGLAVGTLALSEGTNTVIKFLNPTPVSYTTNAPIFTNTLWPSLVNMTASGARTNWLPKISFQGSTNQYGLIYNIYDASGSASVATPLSIRPQGGASIDGTVSYNIDRPYGSVSIRVEGTNWVVTDARVGNSLALSGSFTVGGNSIFDTVSFNDEVNLTTDKFNAAVFGDTVLLGLNPDGYLTNVTLGAGLSLAANMTLSASGGSGSSNMVAAAIGNLTLTNVTSLSTTNTGTNATQAWDLLGNARFISRASGPTIFVPTNTPNATNIGTLERTWEITIEQGTANSTVAIQPRDPIQWLGRGLLLEVPPATNTIWMRYNGERKTWVGWTDAVTNSGLSVAGNSGAVQFNEGGALAGTNQMYFNRTNVRFGLGTSLPAYEIEVSNSAPALMLRGTTTSMRMTQSTIVASNSALTGLAIGIDDTIGGILGWYIDKTTGAWLPLNVTIDIGSTGSYVRSNYLNGVIVQSIIYPKNSNVVDVGAFTNAFRTNYANQFEAKDGLRAAGSGGAGRFDAMYANGASTNIVVSGTNSFGATNSGSISFGRERGMEKLSMKSVTTGAAASSVFEWTMPNNTTVGIRSKMVSRSASGGTNMSIFTRDALAYCSNNVVVIVATTVPVADIEQVAGTDNTIDGSSQLLRWRYTGVGAAAINHTLDLELTPIQ